MNALSSIALTVASMFLAVPLTAQTADLLTPKNASIAPTTHKGRSAIQAGGVALWVGPGTEGYFSNLKITAK